MRIGFSRMSFHCSERMFFHSQFSLTPIQLPAPMETQLFYVKPSEVKSELMEKYLDILSPCERKEVSQIRGEEPRKCALLSRALVRTTLARYNSEINPRSLEFRKNIYGKPEIKLEDGLQLSDGWLHGDDSLHSYNWPPHSLHFNISHTSSLVACGVTVGSQIGIDVEEKHRSIKHSSLSFARRYFSQHEVQFLASFSDPRVQQTELIKLWTLKEAYVKAIGRGFSGAPFKTFTIRFKGVTEGGLNTLEDLNEKTCRIVVDSFDDPMEHTSEWNFLLLELDNSHYGAICFEKLSTCQGKSNIPVKLKVWKTIPLLGDECLSGTDAVKTICGLQ